MPTLRSFFALYTDGSAPNDSVSVRAGTELFMGEMAELLVPAVSDELFGPHASQFHRFQPKRGFLLGLSREVKGRPGAFFDEARQAVLQATSGLRGMGLDVLRLWPFPLAGLEEVLPEETLAEDLFSVGFTEHGLHGFRAETFGFAKLGQPEVSFEFHGRALVEEAALLCGHLADWVLDNGHDLSPGQSLAFGFDRLTLRATAEGPSRTWHPPLIQRLIPEALFPGVGVLELDGKPEVALPSSDEHALSAVLTRSLDQRLMLEELDLPGDSPHAQAHVRVSGELRSLVGLVAWREEHADSKDSGWRFRSRAATDSSGWRLITLSELVSQVPGVLGYLALPWGIRLEWTGAGTVTVDTSRVRQGAGDTLDTDD